MNTTRVAVDLAKSVFQVAVSHAPGRVAEEHRLSRARFREFFLHQPPCHVLMEACGSAHHWGRELQALGHQVSLLPAAHVARYRLGNKTDRTDTRALLEAGRNEKITPVPVKSLEQQAITANREGGKVPPTPHRATGAGLFRYRALVAPEPLLGSSLEPVVLRLGVLVPGDGVGDQPTRHPGGRSLITTRHVSQRC